MPRSMSKRQVFEIEVAKYDSLIFDFLTSYWLTEDSFQFTFKVSSVLKTGTIALIFSTYGTTI